MASLSAYCLCITIVLGMCSASIQPNCPVSCQCQNSTISCDGCPSSYVAVYQTTRHLFVKNCKDIQYLLKFHQQRHNDVANTTSFSLSKLEIRDSFIRQPEMFIYSDYNIQSLVLSNNSINRINPDVKYSNVTYLDLSHNSISSMDNRTFMNVKKLLYLDLSGNCIVNLSVECFSGLDKLLNLDLSYNNLSRLSDKIFAPLTSLQKLNLSMNRLETLFEKSFSSLLMLQQLDVSYNRLTSVAPGTLQFLPNLAKLLLADNPQLRPDAQIFVGTGRRLQQVDASRTGLSQVPEALTHSVRYLTLAGNRIAAVSCGDLDSYPLLHMLDFTYNIISDIEDDALGRLEMLSQLYLNNNRLRTVPKMLPDKLHYLSMDTNLIGNLTITDFTTLTNLKILILSNNAISYIQENAFYQLISLEVLDLSNNPLKALTPNTFSGPVSLKDLRIAFVNISPPAKDISFPVPSPEGIENLHLEFSPGLTRQLMADTAALAAMTRLQHLDMRYSNVTTIRSDLLHFWPQLKVLRLEGNKLNCTDLGWLADWMRENPTNNYEQVKCASPSALVGKLVIDLHTPASTQHPVYVYRSRFSSINVTNQPKGNMSKTINNTKTSQKRQNLSMMMKRPENNYVLNHLRNVSSILNDVNHKIEDKVMRFSGVRKNENDTNQIDNSIDGQRVDVDRRERRKNEKLLSREDIDKAEETKRTLISDKVVARTPRLDYDDNEEYDKSNKIDSKASLNGQNVATDKTDAQSKLLEIFSEWSQREEKISNESTISGEKGETVVSSTKETINESALEVKAFNNNDMPHGENASVYQTSRFSAEEHTGFGGNGAIAIVGAGVAVAGAALAVAWAARRRPRPARRHQDLMEVPTIAAVGELW